MVFSKVSESAERDFQTELSTPSFSKGNFLVVTRNNLKRYYLLGKNIPRTAPDARSATSALLDELKVDPEQYRFGVTKVFFRSGQLASIEERREKKIGELLINIQSGRAFRSTYPTRCFQPAEDTWHVSCTRE
jgi:myosin heavy subunit